MVATGEEEDHGSSATHNRTAQLRHGRAVRPHEPEHRSVPCLDQKEEVLVVHLLLASGGTDAERLDLPPTSSRRDSDQPPTSSRRNSDQPHQIHRPTPPCKDNESHCRDFQVPYLLRFQWSSATLVVPLAKRRTRGNKERKCKSYPRDGCRKCQVPLCVACFVTIAIPHGLSVKTH